MSEVDLFGRWIAFAPLKGAKAVERYGELGGRRRAGKVSIHMPMGGELEDRFLTCVVAEQLNLPEKFYPNQPTI